MTARRRTVRGSGVVLALALLVAACSSSGHQVTSTTSSSSSTSTTTSTTAPPLKPTTTTTAPLRLSARKLGPIHVGMTQAEATATGLIGAFTSGCEIQSPPPQDAPLLPPLVGTVEVTDGHVSSIGVRAGAPTDPGGVSGNTTLDQAKAAFEAAGLTVKVDTSTAGTFNSWFVDVTQAGQPVFGFAADAAAPHTVGIIFTPSLLVCE